MEVDSPLIAALVNPIVGLLLFDNLHRPKPGFDARYYLKELSLVGMVCVIFYGLGGISVAVGYVLSTRYCDL